ncbi:hypothetical protein B566_EDAN001321 [Ephemera danica]|nr:hypothetical protein B566_EDAN001321 [Ephemera danica]
MLNNGGQIVFFVTVITLVSEGAFELTSQKKLNKRNEVDFPTCLENFDIHTDTIIRAQDSRAIGGRYINETEVSSREDCLKLCCQTSLCDVFIFEEKSPGSCYLFDCGSSDDFKCKFNPHRHYTSGVMAVNRHVAELESQVKLSKHEEELAGLRKSLQATLVQHTTVVALPTQTAPTTSTSTQKPAAPSTAVQPNQANSNVTGKRHS